MTAGIILAAGESRRMGFPKALLRYRDETFLDTLIGLFAARCSPVIVVLGAHAERIRAGVARPATFVVNPDYARGRPLPCNAACAPLPADAEGVLFTLVDHPGGGARHAGCAAAPRRDPLLRVPRYQGKRGHPIWFSRELIAEFLAMPEDGAARDVVRAHAAETEFLDVDDPGIVADIDDAEAYRGLTGAARMKLRRPARSRSCVLAAAPAADRGPGRALLHRRPVCAAPAGLARTLARAPRGTAGRAFQPVQRPGLLRRAA